MLRGDGWFHTGSPLYETHELQSRVLLEDDLSQKPVIPTWVAITISGFLVILSGLFAGKFGAPQNLSSRIVLLSRSQGACRRRIDVCELLCLKALSESVDKVASPTKANELSRCLLVWKKQTINHPKIVCLHITIQISSLVYVPFLLTLVGLDLQFKLNMFEGH